jgi:hypothetical protein
MAHKPALYGTVIVLVHAVIAVFHRAAHDHLHVDLSFFQQLFVYIIIVAAPFLAVFLLWTRFRRSGAWLLWLSMAGALVFGIAYHFIVVSPDNVAEIPEGEWGMVFKVTAILLAILEALACWIGIWALMRKSTASPSSE